jgi:hypothetical protein
MITSVNCIEYWKRMPKVKGTAKKSATQMEKDAYAGRCVLSRAETGLRLSLQNGRHLAARGRDFLEVQDPAPPA